MLYRSLLAFVLLGMCLPAAAAAAGPHTLYPRPDGSLSTTPAATTIREGTFYAPAAPAAFTMAEQAQVMFPSRLLLNGPASAQLFVNGKPAGEGHARGSLLGATGLHSMRLDNPRLDIAAGDILSLTLKGAGGAGSEAPRLVYQELPAAPTPHSATPTPNPATPAPVANATPSLPTPSNMTPGPTLPPTTTAAPAPTSAQGSADPQAGAVSGGEAPSFDPARMWRALPDGPLLLALAMLSSTAIAGIGLFRLGRE